MPERRTPHQGREAVRRPCPSCPWRVDQRASSIPNFSLELAEGLAKTCASEQPDHVVMIGQAMFACHQSQPGNEVVCAGWLAVEGYHHMTVRLGIGTGEYTHEMLEPGPGWPELHTCYREVIEKLREDMA